MPQASSMSDTGGTLQAAPPSPAQFCLATAPKTIQAKKQTLLKKTEQKFRSKYFESKFTEITKAPKQS